MKADDLFKELGFTKKSRLKYIEYNKRETDGVFTISILLEPFVSVYIRKYTDYGSFPEALTVKELKALYKKIEELENGN